jgi:recombination protein RecT
LKSVIKRLIKYLPLSVETQTAVANDETVRKDITVDPFIIEAEPMETNRTEIGEDNHAK